MSSFSKDHSVGDLDVSTDGVGGGDGKGGIGPSFIRPK